MVGGAAVESCCHLALQRNRASRELSRSGCEMLCLAESRAPGLYRKPSVPIIHVHLARGGLQFREHKLPAPNHRAARVRPSAARAPPARKYCSIVTCNIAFQKLASCFLLHVRIFFSAKTARSFLSGRTVVFPGINVQYKPCIPTVCAAHILKYCCRIQLDLNVAYCGRPRPRRARERRARSLLVLAKTRKRVKVRKLLYDYKLDNTFVNFPMSHDPWYFLRYYGRN